MAYFHNYLVELQIGKDANLEKLFNLALRQVFSPQYLQKIEGEIKKRIKIKETINKNTNIVAWVQGTTIYVNTPIFNQREYPAKIRYLLHEFMHVLNNSKSFLVQSKFKDIKDLSNKLWEVVKEHTKDPGKFLTGNTIDKKLLNNQEALSYLMNDKIQWGEITPEGKKSFIEALEKSGVFNLEHEFWKKRLR